MMGTFNITVPLEKSLRADGDDRWMITGIASGTGVDAERDLIRPEHIERFANQINEAPIPLKNWHVEKDITSELGEVSKAWITDDLQLGVEIELDKDNPTAQWLWRKIEKGKQFGLSIHGGASSESRVVNSLGQVIRNLGEIVLDEISVTTKPAYTPSFGTVVRKSLEEAEELQEDKQLSENTTEVVPQVDEAAGTAVTPTATVTEVVVEKSVTTETKRDEKDLQALVASVKRSNELIAKMGLDAENNGETVEPVVEKSSTTDSDFRIVLEKSLAAQAEKFEAQIESLKELIPGNLPPVIVSKSKEEEMAEQLAGMSPSDRIKFGLAGIHQGK